jgi:hypothetical protein
MSKFGSHFFGKSPIKEVAKGRVGRLRKRAQRRSEKSGETGGYDYSDMKVLKLLGKAKRIENKNFIKNTGAKKGSKRKGSMYGEDARVSASYDRPDSDSNSPLEGAYTSGAGGQVYVSNREDFQNLQDRIAGAAISAIAGENDPQTQLERAQKRKAKIDAKGITTYPGVTDEKGNAIYVDKDGKVINRGKQKLERAAKLQKKADAAQDLLKQRAENRRANFNLSDYTDDQLAAEFGRRSILEDK